MKSHKALLTSLMKENSKIHKERNIVDEKWNENHHQIIDVLDDLFRDFKVLKGSVASPEQYELQQYSAGLRYGFSLIIRNIKSLNEVLAPLKHLSMTGGFRLSYTEEDKQFITVYPNNDVLVQITFDDANKTGSAANNATEFCIKNNIKLEIPYQLKQKDKLLLAQAVQNFMDLS